MNKLKFYDYLRTEIFGGAISIKQFDGIAAIIKAFESFDLRYTAYALATAFHETGKTMQPVREGGRGAGYDYGKKLKMGGGRGKRIPYTTPDFIFYGRGLIQTTWYENYEILTKAAKKHGHNWDLLNNPDLLLQMEPSIWALKYGMLNGIYTGKRLVDYFNTKETDPIGARKIVNGNDQAIRIGRFYSIFYKALTINP